MLRQLQTSSVAVVKDCFHAVEVACAEDFFEDPRWAVARFFNDRALVPSLAPSAGPRQLLCTLLYEHRQYFIHSVRAWDSMLHLREWRVCVCVCLGTL